MSSGRTHDKINGFFTLAALTGGLVLANPLLISTSIGMALGTLWLSPDLDMPHTLPAKRLGILRPFLWPYVQICGRHRSPISHSPIFSSLIRVFYFGFLPALLLYCQGYQDLLIDLLLSSEFLAVLVGLEISTDLHLFLDIQHSIRKKFDL